MTRLMNQYKNLAYQGAPICRWIYQDIKVDVMPTDENVLGFNNQWYPGVFNVELVRSLLPARFLVKHRRLGMFV
jgi:hypothetical protein